MHLSYNSQNQKCSLKLKFGLQKKNLVKCLFVLDRSLENPGYAEF